MGILIDQITISAGDWQKPIAEIRVNIGFMHSELEHFKNSSIDASDLENLLADFDVVFRRFCDDELQVFVACRQVETSDDKKRDILIDKLKKMQESFGQWLYDMNKLIESRQALEQDIQLMLLLTCGAQILNAHTTFLNTVDLYITGLDI